MLDTASITALNTWPNLKLPPPSQSRQYLFSDDLFINHTPLVTDSFTLYVKGAILLGRVKTFNIRFKSCYSASFGPQGPHNVEPRATAGFIALDNLIARFIASFPKHYHDPIDIEHGNKVDRVLYTALLLPHL